MSNAIRPWPAENKEGVRDSPTRAFISRRTILFSIAQYWEAPLCDAGFMLELIVIEKIDGNPVAWRCSECRQKFTVRGKLTTQERHKQVAAEFKAHVEELHGAEDHAGNIIFAT